MKALRILGISALALVAVVLALTLLPPVLLPEAPAPASIARFVDGARRRIWTEATLPLHVRFVTAQCAGERVALIFELWQSPHLGTAYAIAMRGSMPTSVDDMWGLAMGRDSASIADEFLYQMGANTIPCPLVASPSSGRSPAI